MNYPAIAQWAGGCLTSHSGEGRGLDPRERHVGPGPGANSGSTWVNVFCILEGEFLSSARARLA